MSKFKIVVLESIIDCVSDPLAKELFSKMIELKVLGYRCDYNKGVLPVSTQDFFCSHLLVCTEINGELWPVSAYRSVSLSGCIDHHEGFPIQELFHDIGDKANGHKEAVDSLIVKADGSVYYNSSFTSLPEYRGDKDILNLIISIDVNFHTEKNTSVVLAAGSDRFKMHRYYYQLGYKDLGDEKLPSLPIAHADGELCSFYYLDSDFSSEARQVAESNKEVWDSRIIINEGQTCKKKIAA